MRRSRSGIPVAFAAFKIPHQQAGLRVTKPIDQFPREVELKLAFLPEIRAGIEGHPAFHTLGSGGARTTHELSTYFDTPDLALMRDGLSLRVRTRENRRTQTLKYDPHRNGATASRAEWEWSVMTDNPDTGLLTGTPAERHAAASLEPVVTTDIHRTVRILTLDSGTVIESAIDEGTIAADEKKCPVHELELELKAGPPGPLYGLALTLHADLPLRIEAEAKATRGYRLRTGDPAPAHKTPQPELDHSVTLPDGFRIILGAALGALIANQPAALEEDPEGVHQMRIAVRRLRTALALFKPHLEPHATTRFENELRQLGLLLGDTRDWDVFCLETLPTALDPSFRPLLETAAQTERDAARQRLRHAFQQPDLTGLVLAMAAWAEHEDLLLDPKLRQARLIDVAGTLLDRLARKVAKRGRHIQLLSGPDLHAVRKSLKKLRYAVDDLDCLYRHKDVKAYRRHCKDLQDRLGTLNDAAVAVALAEKLTQDGHVDRVPAVAAVTRWSGDRQHKASHKLADAWAEFRNASPFWR